MPAMRRARSRRVQLKIVVVVVVVVVVGVVAVVAVAVVAVVVVVVVVGAVGAVGVFGVGGVVGDVGVGVVVAVVPWLLLLALWCFEPAGCSRECGGGATAVPGQGPQGGRARSVSLLFSRRDNNAQSCVPQNAFLLISKSRLHHGCKFNRARLFESCCRRPGGGSSV